MLALKGKQKSYPALFILDEYPQQCRLASMKLPSRKLLIALVFGLGAMAAPAGLLIIEAANAPQPELRNPAYARTLLAQDTHTEYNSLFLWRAGVAFGHPALNGNRAIDGLDHARELDQQTISGRLDYPTLVFGDLWVNEFVAVCSKPSEGARLILTHEAAIAGDIGGQNGREPALYPLTAQYPLRRFPPLTTE